MKTAFCPMGRLVRCLSVIGAVYLIVLIFLPLRAMADLSWLKEANTCASFSRGLQEYFSKIEDLESLDAEQRRELSIVLEEACGERFRSCAFEVCRALNAPQAPAAEQTGSDGLDWLNHFMTCAQFTAEIKKRYADVGRLGAASAEKRRELDYVLEVACSVRFAHCGFKNCGGSVQPPGQPLPSPAAPEPEENKIAPDLRPDLQSTPAETTPAPAASSFPPALAPSPSLSPSFSPSPSPSPSPSSSPSPSPSPSAAPSLIPTSASPLVPAPSPVLSAPPLPLSPAPAGPENQEDPKRSERESEREAAESQFNTEFREWQARQRRMIEQAVAEEKKNNAAWERLGHPDELRAPNPDEEQSTERPGKGEKSQKPAGGRTPSGNTGEYRDAGEEHQAVPRKPRKPSAQFQTQEEQPVRPRGGKAAPPPPRGRAF